MIRTKQRELILEAVRAAKTHPTADELFQIIRKQLPMISLATIYRNLNYMAEEGIIRRLTVPGMPDRFDRCTEPHDHMICDCCGGVFDFKLPFDLNDEIAQMVGGPINSYALVAHGCCAACSENA